MLSQSPSLINLTVSVDVKHHGTMLSHKLIFAGWDSAAAGVGHDNQSIL